MTDTNPTGEVETPEVETEQTEADKVEVETKTDVKTFTQEQVDAIAAAARKEGAEKALQRVDADTLQKQIQDLQEKAAKAEAAARNAQLDALATEFGIDRALFEAYPKDGDELRSHVEALAKLKGETKTDPVPESKPKITLSEVRKLAKKSSEASNESPFAAAAMAAAARLGGE